jgi:hypothetical protein
MRRVGRLDARARFSRKGGKYGLFVDLADVT